MSNSKTHTFTDKELDAAFYMLIEDEFSANRASIDEKANGYNSIKSLVFARMDLGEILTKIDIERKKS